MLEFEGELFSVSLGLLSETEELLLENPAELEIEKGDESLETTILLLFSLTLW